MASSARIRLLVLFGGQSAEHDVSCTSARHVLEAVDPQRYAVEPIGITREGRWVRAEAAQRELAKGVAAMALPAQLEAAGPDIDLLPALSPTGEELTVVFPVLHGPMGEDGTVQGMLELLGVPYVGTGVLGSALAMDKIKAKQMLDAHGIAQARWRGLHANDLNGEALATELIEELGLPLFVKPANLGSSVGVSRANSVSETIDALELAASYDEWIVVEEAIVGREIECAVLGNLEPRASLPGEVRPAADFYDYEDKYVDGAAELIIPAELSADETARLQAMACETFLALRGEGIARVDFFYEEGGRGLLINEINTMPGFTPISMYPKMWQASGLEYPELIDELVNLAIERFERRQQHRSTKH